MLEKILKHKKEELDSVKLKIPLSDIKKRAVDRETAREFAGALKQKSKSLSKIIGEVKKASPSKGVIRQDFDPVAIARIYEEGGATAISCLTEKNYFLGDLSYIDLIKNEVSLPVLRKDFIVDEYQIYEARAYGADAILLIAAVLEKQQLSEFSHMAAEAGLDSLIEVHSEEDILHALNTQAIMLGINNRDLTTFKTDINLTRKLIKHIPDTFLKISESGIRTKEDIDLLTKAGADAFLIGEALTREENILKKITELGS
ncbi:MAG: indole-3-glycerol phosphate synthase TrpC [Nitrospinota bacterium]